MKPQSSSPLLAGKGGKKLVSSATLLSHIVVFIFIPWLAYFFLVGASLYYFDPDKLGKTGSLMGFLLLELAIVLYCFMQPKAWVRSLAGLTLSVIVVGSLVSGLNEFEHLVYYRTYSSMREYTNVLATVSAKTILDAGVVDFASNTFVDTTRATKFRSFTKPGMEFCVAPVLDSTFGPTDEVGIWAVGIGCCGHRASFYCDDSDDPSAKSAIVILPPEEVIPAWVRALGVGDNHYDDYLKALKLSAATFKVALADNVRLVRWIKDTEDLVAGYLRDGKALWLESSLAMLGLLIFGNIYVSVTAPQLLM